MASLLTWSVFILIIVGLIIGFIAVANARKYWTDLTKRDSTVGWFLPGTPSLLFGVCIVVHLHPVPRGLHNHRLYPLSIFLSAIPRRSFNPILYRSYIIILSFK